MLGAVSESIGWLSVCFIAACVLPSGCFSRQIFRNFNLHGMALYHSCLSINGLNDIYVELGAL